MVAGIENNGSYLNDTKLGYPDFENAVIVDNQIVSIPFADNTTVANQYLNTTGLFAQYDFIIKRLKLSLGGRFDNYVISNLEDSNASKEGKVFSPRANALFDFTGFLQGRLSYSQGFRAPQIFDEDLHIETSGSRQVINRNADDLEQETSYNFV